MRIALTAEELEQITATARAGGNDPILDTLLLRLHTETACRRGGALALRVCDLGTGECLVRLWQKSQTLRRQPVSPPLAQALAEHAAARAHRPDSDLLRYHDGSPLTAHIDRGRRSND